MMRSSCVGYPTCRFMGSPKRPREITRHNFRLREGELGVSGNIKSKMSPEELLLQPGALPGARIATARVGDIRALGFEVEIAEVDGSPGHVEIRPITGDLSDKGTQEALAKLFSFDNTACDSTNDSINSALK